MAPELRIHVLETPEEAAAAAADEISRHLTRTVRDHGRASCALSRVSDSLADSLAASDPPWRAVDLFQVDERIAPDGTPDRNATAIAPLAGTAGGWHPMPVSATEPLDGARRYDTTLQRVTGGELDVVHLGLGPDGHTASLLPGDSAVAVTDRLVAPTGATISGFRRLTLTFGALNAARHVVWLVTGDTKAVALRDLVAADPAIPAGRVLQDRAVVFADIAAAAIILRD